MDGRWVEVLTDNEWRPGDIKMFAGNESQIQAGWQLCNGVGQTSNGIQIPNLKDKFIVCSGGAYATGTSGGAVSKSTSTNGDHQHSINVDYTTLSVAQMPSHTHTGGYQGANTSGSTGSSLYDGRDFIQKNNPLPNTGSSHGHNHSAGCSVVGNHSHTVDVTPPYYALAFIIKL